MKKNLCSILLLFYLLVGIVACHSSEEKQPAGENAILRHHPGKYLFINYWAPWCTPCKKEIPEFNQFYLAHRDTVLVYGVDFDHPGPAQLQATVKKMGIQYPVLEEDPAKILKLEEVQSLPMTFVFDPQGKLVKTLVGPQTMKELVAALPS